MSVDTFQCKISNIPCSLEIVGVDYQVRPDETFLFGKMYLENFSTEVEMIPQRVIVVIFG